MAIVKTSPTKHLLVDLDGTLLGNNALPLSVEFVKESMLSLNRFGGWRKSASVLLAIQKEFSTKGLRKNDIRIVELFAKKMELSLEESRSVLRESLFVIFPKLEKYFFPIQGAKEFLDWAKDHYELILATNPVWPPEIVEMRVKWAGIEPKLFSYMTHIREMHACKPSAEYYNGILETKKLKAEECLLIGNDMKMDLPAQRVGIRVFIVGDYKKLTVLEGSRKDAAAWRGSYGHLKELLLGQG